MHGPLRDPPLTRCVPLALKLAGLEHLPNTTVADTEDAAGLGSRVSVFRRRSLRHAGAVVVCTYGLLLLGSRSLPRVVSRALLFEASSRPDVRPSTYPSQACE